MERIRAGAEGQEEQNTNFETQFAQREHFDLAGGNAEVVDITPEKLKDETPLFFAPGWGSDIPVYKGTLEVLSGENRRVISLNHPRRGGDLKAHATEEALAKYPEEEEETLRRAYNILAILEQKKIEQVDAIAHSQGALDITMAAMLHPEKFRNIVYFAPVGLVGHDDIPRLFKGFLDQQNRPASLKDYPISKGEEATDAAFLESAKSYLKANPLRALRETMEVADAQIHEMIADLHGKGIGIIVMSPEDDPVFPMEMVTQYAKIESMDMFAVTKGGHGGIAEQPELFAAEAEEMVSALQWEKENTVDGVKPDLADYFKTIGYV